MPEPDLTAEQRDYIDAFLRTGHVEEPLSAPWPGQNIIERAHAAHKALRGALVAAVRRRERDVRLPTVPSPTRLHAMTRERVAPMVRGLFPAVEQDTMLAPLQGSVVFLTPENISEVLHAQSFDHSAWDLANLYLGSIDAELLSEQAPDLLGLSQETSCFVTSRYLEGRDKFDDFIVHEAAHVFHNWKREYAGLPFTRTKEWLLPIEFGKRETFAYSCEVYSRIVEQGRTPKQRQALFEEYAGAPHNGAEDVAEHVDILREAVSARNGWKRILRRVEPKKLRSTDVNALEVFDRSTQQLDKATPSGLFE
jgi:hypothetical protein